MGIVNTDDMQIVYSDTPGVLSPHYKLQESMLNFSQSALTDADILLYVTDVIETPDKNPDFLQRVTKETIPVILVINKIDLLQDQSQLESLVESWKSRLPKAEIIPVSAQHRFNLDYLMRRIQELLPPLLHSLRKTHSPTSRPASSSPRLSEKRYCSPTTRRYPMPAK